MDLSNSTVEIADYLIEECQQNPKIDYLYFKIKINKVELYIELNAPKEQVKHEFMRNKEDPEWLRRKSIVIEDFSIPESTMNPYIQEICGYVELCTIDGEVHKIKFSIEDVDY